MGENSGPHGVDRGLDSRFSLVPRGGAQGMISHVAAGCSLGMSQRKSICCSAHIYKDVTLGWGGMAPVPRLEH